MQYINSCPVYNEINKPQAIMKYFLLLSLVIIASVLAFPGQTDESLKTTATNQEKSASERSVLDLIKVNNNEYFLSQKQKLRWIEALYFCKNFDMELAVIDNEVEQKSIIDLLHNKNMTDHMVYIGATKIGKSDFVWLTGDSVDYKKWYGGYEADDGDYKYCAGIKNAKFKSDYCIMPGGNYFLCKQIYE